MSKKTFAALLSADLEPETLEYWVGTEEDGRDGELILKPMGATPMQRLARFQEGGEQAGDQEAFGRYVVAQTVVGGSLWTRGDKQWVEAPVPEEKAKREKWWADQDLTLEFWAWLLVECLRVNGMANENDPDSPAGN